MGVVERGPLLGREQEWNISEAELEEMVEAKVLSKEVGVLGGGPRGGWAGEEGKGRALVCMLCTRGCLPWYVEVT